MHPKLDSFQGWLVGAMIALSLLVLFLAAPPVQAATLPAGFSESRVVENLAFPTAFAFAPDGRIFVTQQRGAVRVVKGTTLLTTPFTTVPVDSSGERGLLGIAFHPNFPASPFVYLYYTVPGNPAHNRISRFTAKGDVAVPNSEEILVDLEDLGSTPIHNAGAMHFGLDGNLYVSVGDAGDAINAQKLTNRLGKILRYDSDGEIPPTNPFYDGSGENADAIWAYGLRNPFTFAIQPDTGRIFINDVGWGEAEEVNDGIAGSNYGWPWCEGVCKGPNPDFRDPLYAYAHGQVSDNGCAIVGGTFYNPSVQQFPSEYRGEYFFGDMCGGWIHRYDPGTNTVSNFASNIAVPVDMHVSSDGSLYYLARGTGQLWRVTYANPPNGTPTPTNTPTPTATRTITPTFTPTVCPVSKPTVMKPKAKSISVKRRVRLDWLDDSCADFYRVRVQKQDGTAGSNVDMNASKYRTDALKRGELYQFRVIACNALNCKRSKWTKFSISATPGP